MELRNKSVQDILYCFKAAQLCRPEIYSKEAVVSDNLLQVSAFRVATYGRFDCTLESSCYDIINIMRYSF